MTKGKVAVFGASSRPGQGQVRQLRAAGYDVRPITRQTSADEMFKGLDVVPADYRDFDSLCRACEGADGVFITLSGLTDVSAELDYIHDVGRAAAKVGVGRVVNNTTTWHPDDEPCGAPTLDHAMRRSNALRQSGAAYTIIRPQIFMDNLLTRFAKPFILAGDFSYPHKPDMKAAWNCLDDVGKFMIAALERPEMENVTIDVAGPERLGPADVAERLSEVVGRKVTYTYITPRAFAERMYKIFPQTGMSRDEFIDYLEIHYIYKNKHDTFDVDIAPILERLPIQPTTMREWLRQQDWTPEGASLVGSASG